MKKIYRRRIEIIVERWMEILLRSDVGGLRICIRSVSRTSTSKFNIILKLLCCEN